MASLRTSPLSWCGNPPVLPGAYRYVSPLNQGIPTPVCATSRNDSVISVFQLLIRIRGGRCPSAHTGADEGLTCRTFSPYQNRSTGSKVSLFIVTISEISTFSPHPSRLRRATFPRGGRFFRCCAKRSFMGVICV